jgi:adenosylcobinamide kinase / adenosylcobinamide-phosphate guanylyltransferase
MAPHIQLILGGARSGKSRYALNQETGDAFHPRVFIATATAGDEEMKQRIKQHKLDRDKQWRTIEEPYHLTKTLARETEGGGGLVVVDCTTFWISNLLCGMGGKALSLSEIETEFQEFLKTLPQLKGNIRVVANEVGLSIVPDNVLARNFRDLQGELNQRLAALASQVFFMTAGIPQKIK